jgi:hypothetical protein
MNPEIVAVKSALMLLVLWFFLYYLWQDYRIDAFREHVFSIGDRLFKFAASGGVGFKDPAYTMLHDRMNVLLRYAHEFTFFRVVSIALVQPSAKNTDKAKWEEAVNALPSEASKQKLREFDTILVIAVLQLMIYRSFFLYVVVRPWAPFVEPPKVLKDKPIVVARVEQLLELISSALPASLRYRRPFSAPLPPKTRPG